MRETPQWDDRTSQDIYKRALELAKIYCPQWNPQDPEDYGIMLLKLFSQLSESVVRQLNQIPHKNFLAFLDFMGIDPLPARIARTFLTFELAKGSDWAVVPKGTQVACSKAPEVIFETKEDLTVIDVGFDSIFSLNPYSSYYQQHSLKKDSEFTIFTGDTQIESVLYITDDLIFDFATPVKLTVELETPEDSQHNIVKNLLWYNLEGKLLDFTWQGNSFVFEVSHIPEGKINGVTKRGLKGHWQNHSAVDELFKISNITVYVIAQQVLPEKIILNDTPFDIQKGFYPFGETPKQWDELYFSSSVFSKENAEVFMDVIGCQDPESPKAKLQWEYWNGQRWQELHVNDQTESFTKEGKISFVCPKIFQVEVNNERQYWIRTKIVSEKGYGEPGKFNKVNDLEEVFAGFSEKQKIIQKLAEINITSGLQYSPPALHPPYVKSIYLGYEYQKSITQVQIYSNFQYHDVSLEGNNANFSLNDYPALFLGFQKNIMNRPLSLFFLPVEKRSESFNEAHRELVWQYYDGQQWQKFEVENNATLFITTHIAKFFGPSNIQKTTLFSRERYWIKLQLESHISQYPRLQGIFLNTVPADNSFTMENEVLGSGTGQPNLALQFSQAPVLPGEIVEIRESSIPTSKELELLGHESLRVVQNEYGETTEIWTTWKKVVDFSLSTSLSRHYVLDRDTGKIQFGDGIRGLIPEIRPRNIVARRYRSGGGKIGNVGEHEVDQITKNIANIQKVTNYSVASGGMDAETEQQAVERGPQVIKHRNRAVTIEDFQWLAREASQQIAKVCCFSEKIGEITVVIVPNYPGKTPTPENFLREDVLRYLQARALFTIRDHIQVIGPTYIDLSLELELETSVSESGKVFDEVYVELQRFFHPLSGKSNRNGWDLGATIFMSEIVGAVYKIPGVQNLHQIKLWQTEKPQTMIDKGKWNLPKHALPKLSKIKICAPSQGG